jgi:uncharacterized protein (TIGR03067 family)
MHWQLLTVVLALGAADDKKTDADKLQGTWVAVSVEHSGKTVPEDKVKNVKAIFKDDTITITTGGQDKPASKFKLDPKKKVKTIDITAGEKEETMQGIYELDGDTLKVCLVAPGKDRPTEFGTKEGEAATLIKFKRDKKE